MEQIEEINQRLVAENAPPEEETGKKSAKSKTREVEPPTFYKEALEQVLSERKLTNFVLLVTEKMLKDLPEESTVHTLVEVLPKAFGEAEGDSFEPNFNQILCGLFQFYDFFGL